VSAAAGARVFTPGARRRFFAEASVSQLGIEVADPGFPAGDERVYGPGLQLGCQWTKPSGFTVMLSVGVGHTVGGPPHLQGAKFLMGVGLGHTWLRR
jgi:hypothetical protein